MEMNEPPILAEAHLRTEMASALADAAPTAWRELRYTAASVGGVTDIQASAVFDDERVEPLDAPGRVSLLRSKLRTAMYEPGTGTWFSMTLTVTHDGRAEATYNYDEEPWSHVPIVSSAWLADQEKFPRDPEHRPAWLQRKLAEAGHSDLPRR
jgi:hypothetical protein